MKSTHGLTERECSIHSTLHTLKHTLIETLFDVQTCVTNLFKVKIR